MLRKMFFEYMYLRHPRWDTGITPPELVDFIKTQPPGNALDLGCGSGTNAIYLAQNGWKVTAVDYSYLAISRAKRKSAKLHLPIRWLYANVVDLRRLKESFQLILDIGCFHGLTSIQKQKYIQQLDRLLTEGGTYLLYGFLESGFETVVITKEDIKNFQKILTLEMYTIGVDGRHQSGWLRFKKAMKNGDEKL